MTVKITITHDEPKSDRTLYAAMLAILSGYDQPQIQNQQAIEPGKSVTFHVHAGAKVEIWEAPTKQELLVADEIELAMNPSKKVPAPTLDPKVRILVARAAIAAAARNQ